MEVKVVIHVLRGRTLIDKLHRHVLSVLTERILELSVNWYAKYVRKEHIPTQMQPNAVTVMKALIKIFHSKVHALNVWQVQ